MLPSARMGSIFHPHMPGVRSAAHWPYGRTTYDPASAGGIVRPAGVNALVLISHSILVDLKQDRRHAVVVACLAG